MKVSYRPERVSQNPESTSWVGRHFPLLLTLTTLAMVFGYPLLNEETGSECGALAQAVAITNGDGSQSVIGTALARTIMQPFAEEGVKAAVKRAWPSVPAVLSCTYVYWKHLLTGDFAIPQEPMPELLR